MPHFVHAEVKKLKYYLTSLLARNAHCLDLIQMSLSKQETVFSREKAARNIEEETPRSYQIH